MIPTIDDIEKAKKWMKPLWPENCPKDHAASIVRFCMDFTAKAMGEPSEEAIECGYSAGDGERKAKTIFKAMAQQIAKECGDV